MGQDVIRHYNFFSCAAALIATTMSSRFSRFPISLGFPSPFSSPPFISARYLLKLQNFLLILFNSVNPFGQTLCSV